MVSAARHRTSLTRAGLLKQLLFFVVVHHLAHNGQCCFAVLVPDIYVCSCIQKDLNYAAVSINLGYHKRRLPVLVLGVYVNAVCQHRLNFGLFGVLGVFAFRYRKEIPDSISRAIKRRVLPLIVINLMLGFSTSIVDNSAHVGGLVAGAVLCLVVPYKRPHEESTPVVWRTLQGISLSIIALSFVMAFRSYDGPPLRLSNLAARDSNRTPRTPAGKYVTEMATADDAMTSARRTFYALVAMQNVEMSASPALAAVRQGLRSIEQTPRMDEPAEAFRRQLFDLLARQEEIIELHDASPSKNWKKELADQRELASRHSQFEEEFVPWLEEYAKKHGVPITGAPDNQ